MSRRAGKGAKANAFGKSDSAGLATIERMLDKANYKDALKQARVAYRQQASPEGKRLLERASFYRAEELAKRGLNDEAKEISHQLLDLGVSEPAVLSGLLLLLPNLGLEEKAIVLQGRISPEDRAKVSCKLADRAVVRPEKAAAGDPELTAAAERVRGAVEALDAGNEAQAFSLLQDIPRSSPLAEWRYFVRGLAADRRGDRETARANWSRLDPERAAFSIVRALETARTAADGDLSKFEVAIFGGSVLPKLKRLQNALEADDWKAVWTVAAPLYELLKRNDLALAHRLAEVLIDEVSASATAMSFEHGEALLKRLQATIDPLPLDPKWNRMWALLWENSTFWTRAVDCWRAYLADLDSLAGLPADASRVKAMVWRRIAEAYGREVASVERLGDTVVNYERAKGAPELSYEDHLLAREATLAGQRAAAIDALKTSLKLDPAQKETYESALKLYEAWDLHTDARAIVEQMMARFPGDERVFELSFERCWEGGDFDAALSLVEQARRARPLDETLLRTEWRVRHEIVCRHAAAKEFTLAHQEHARIAALPLGFPRFALLAHEAAIHFKADDLPAATQLLQQAQATEAGKPPALLAAWMAGQKMKLPADWQASISQEWKKAAKKKNADSAAAIARWMLIPEVSQVLGDDAHPFHSLVIDYLSRATRVKFQTAEDVEAVCRYLSKQRGGAEGLDKLARRAKNLFPDSPHAYVAMAQAEIARGPRRYRAWMAEYWLNEAQARAASDVRHSELLEEIKSLGIWLEDARCGLNDAYDDYDDEYDDEDDVFGGDFFDGDESMPEASKEQVLEIMNEVAEGMRGSSRGELNGEEFARRTIERLKERGIFIVPGPGGEDFDNDCECPACTAKRAAAKKRKR